MRKLNIYLNYNPNALLGTVELTEDGEKMFVMGQHCIVPMLKVDKNKGEIELMDDAGMVRIQSAVPLDSLTWKAADV